MMSSTAAMMEARNSHKAATGRPGRTGMLEKEKPGLGDEGLRTPGNIEAQGPNGKHRGR